MGTKNKTARNIKSLSIVSPVLIRFYDSTPLCKSQQQITTAGDGTVINKDLTIPLPLYSIMVKSLFMTVPLRAVVIYY